MSVYFERFRGNNDPVGRLDKASKAIDTLAMLLVGWLETQAGTDKDFPKLRRFLLTEFARDVKNVNIYLWMATNKAGADLSKNGPNHHTDMLALAMHYMVERGYVRLTDEIADRAGNTGTLPEVCYAVWYKPNEAFQKKLFGKVVLNEKKLLDYCTWREGLNADEAKQWKALLDKAMLGGSPAAAKRGLQDAAADTEGIPMILRRGAKLLLKAQEAPPTTQAIAR